jgi:hypothetical protein
MCALGGTEQIQGPMRSSACRSRVYLDRATRASSSSKKAKNARDTKSAGWTCQIFCLILPEADRYGTLKGLKHWGQEIGWDLEVDIHPVSSQPQYWSFFLKISNSTRERRSSSLLKHAGFGHGSRFFPGCLFSSFPAQLLFLRAHGAISLLTPQFEKPTAMAIPARKPSVPHIRELTCRPGHR